VKGKRNLVGIRSVNVHMWMSDTDRQRQLLKRTVVTMKVMMKVMRVIVMLPSRAKCVTSR